MAKRPEYQAPPEIFYSEDEARKYTNNTRIIDIQSSMTERALELLCLDENVPNLLLDIGCGSGLSGGVVEENGHYWIGVDISESMLKVANERKQEDELSGDIALNDAGQGLPFRAGSFDGAISISALQWLCNADKKSHNPVKRLHTLFQSLYSCLSRGSRAVFQFYPENESQIDLVTKQAMKAGFTGGVVVDYPNSSKAKKFFLVLFTGGSPAHMPQGLQEQSANEAIYSETASKRQRRQDIRKRPPKKSRQWVLEKKERRRRQGREVRPDTKYTGRRRPGSF